MLSRKARRLRGRDGNNPRRQCSHGELSCGHKKLQSSLTGAWFEVGRVELLRQAGLDYKQRESREEFHIAVVEASCRYKSPARYDDELILETHIVALRRSVLKFGYRVLRDETGSLRLLADGETTHVVVDGHLRKIDLPKRFATALEQFMEG